MRWLGLCTGSPGAQAYARGTVPSTWPGSETPAAEFADCARIALHARAHPCILAADRAVLVRRRDAPGTGGTDFGRRSEWARMSVILMSGPGRLDGSGGFSVWE